MATTDRVFSTLVRRETLRERRRLHNEMQVAVAAGGAALPTADVEVRCECLDAECRETFRLPSGVYDDVRRRGEAYFLVIPRHALPDRVVLYADRFFVTVDRSIEGAAIRERARVQRARALRARAEAAAQSERRAAARAQFLVFAERLAERAAYWRELRSMRAGQQPG